jgi:hypothetical protein
MQDEPHRKIDGGCACRKNNQSALHQWTQGSDEAYSTSTLREFPEIKGFNAVWQV